ncbi:MAG TPA: dihydrolipoyl dehydrogenase [Opitutaceae bacterium]|jgi:dihydrolipoamide dehydrogenase
MDPYDVAVIGAGPGGYVCAFRAAQLGLRVALVDRRTTLGGTCLNVGCIPSKALLHSTEQLVFARDHAADHGIRTGAVSADIAVLMKRKEAVVSKLVGGVALLAKGRKVDVIHGEASFTSGRELSVKGPSGATRVAARNFVIATGSAPVELPFMKFDGTSVASSDDAIAFDKAPGSLIVIGGGAIGLELGSVWARLGSQVTVIEFLPRIAPGFDDDLVRAFSRLLQKQGLRIETGARVTGYSQAGGKATVTAERDGKPLEFQADKVLVAVGRRPYTDGLGLDKAGVSLDERRRVRVDERLRTGAPGIWAIGDVIAGPMLAHKAEEDGVAVAEWIAGKAGHVDWNLVPAVVYTDPEAACVGAGEDAARAQGIAVSVGRFNFAANGRAIANDGTDGFVKIVADAKTDRILGAQVLGRGAGELISEVVTHMEYGGSAEDLGRTIHAHPTLSEAVKEAGLAVSKAAIHAI